MPPTVFGTRSAGVLLHPTSLPGPYGAGDIGPSAHRFVEWLRSAGQRWWQMLPVHPPDSTGSPYLARSTRAGSALLISPDDLVRDGWLQPDELERTPASTRASLSGALRVRSLMLKRAFERFEGRLGDDAELRDDFDRFQSTSDWLDDWSLYSAIKSRENGRPWSRWSRDLRRREPSVMDGVRHDLAHEIRWHRFLQFLFDRQWRALREHAHGNGVQLLGDLPFFIAGDSADAWAQPELFALDGRGRPTSVAGTPPDVFTEAGQIWGNPLYEWDVHRDEGFAWWQARVARALDLFDAVRLDHFIGYLRHWSIPARARDARVGHYVPGPGRELFERLPTSPFVAEDLGDVDEEVEELRVELDLPGIRVLVFALGGEDAARHRPEAIEENALCHPASHDNDTVRGWYAALPEDGEGVQATRHAARELFSAADEGTIAGAVVNAALHSRANTAIVQAQDVLGLPSKARMNRPGTARGNWRWRLRAGQLDPDGGAEHAERLRNATNASGRGQD